MRKVRKVFRSMWFNYVYEAAQWLQEQEQEYNSREVVSWQIVPAIVQVGLNIRSGYEVIVEMKIWADD